VTSSAGRPRHPRELAGSRCVIRLYYDSAVAEEEAQDGIARADLRVDSIAWTAEQADHVRTRSSRYPGAVDLEAEWATEADPGPAEAV
jgi:hypothetical protein